MKKLLDLSDECVETLTIEAVKNKTKFKLYVQNILEKRAKKKTSKNNK